MMSLGVLIGMVLGAGFAIAIRMIVDSDRAGCFDAPIAKPTPVAKVVRTDRLDIRPAMRRRP